MCKPSLVKKKKNGKNIHYLNECEAKYGSTVLYHYIENVIKQITTLYNKIYGFNI
jgi:hypothetical protein